jgi:hypothetical protein
MNEDKVVAELEFKAGTARYREDLHDLLTFWKGRSTNAIVLRNIPKEIRGAIESDQWRTQPLPASPILRMAGAYVDFDKLVRIGLVGLKAEVASRLALARKDGGDTSCSSRCWMSWTCWVKLLPGMPPAHGTGCTAPTSNRQAELMRMAEPLMPYSSAPPATLLEALQLAWLYSLMAPLIEFGRLDEWAGDLYARILIPAG